MRFSLEERKRAKKIISVSINIMGIDRFIDLKKYTL